MEICSKNSLSKIEQSELLKLIDGRTVIINLQIRGPSSSSFYWTLQEYDYDDASTYKKFD